MKSEDKENSQTISDAMAAEEVEYVAQKLREVLNCNLLGQGDLALAEEIAKKQFNDDREFMRSVFYQKVKEHLESKGIDTSDLDIKITYFQVSYGEGVKNEKLNEQHLSKEDEEEIRIAFENNEYVALSYVGQLLKEIDYLREKCKVDGEVFNLGRSEGQSDIAVMLRKIVDPEDKKHLNLTGSLKEVERLVEYKDKAHEVIAYIREADALKEFAHSNDDGPSIAELLRECHYLGDSCKDNLR
jgi:hypothetical protein